MKIRKNARQTSYTKKELLKFKTTSRFYHELNDYLCEKYNLYGWDIMLDNEGEKFWLIYNQVDEEENLDIQDLEEGSDEYLETVADIKENNLKISQAELEGNELENEWKIINNK